MFEYTASNLIRKQAWKLSENSYVLIYLYLKIKILSALNDYFNYIVKDRSL